MCSTTCIFEENNYYYYYNFSNFNIMVFLFVLKITYEPILDCFLRFWKNPEMQDGRPISPPIRRNVMMYDLGGGGWGGGKSR